MKHLILFLFLINAANADIVLNAGAGKSIIDLTGATANPFERVGSLGFQFEPSAGFFMRPQFGYFMSGGRGESSFFASNVFGVKAKSESGPLLHVGVGPTYLFSPDSRYLSGHFQFFLEGCAGIESLFNGVYIGMCWHHLSNAGFVQPNKGRDFLQLQVRFLGL